MWGTNNVKRQHIPQRGDAQAVVAPGHLKLVVAQPGERRSARVFLRALVGPQPQMVAFAALLTIAASAMAAALLVSGVGVGSWPTVLLLCALASFAEGRCIRLNAQTEISVSYLFYVFAAITFGPLGAMLVGAASHLSDLPRRDTERPLLRWWVWTSSRALVAGSGGLAALVVARSLEMQAFFLLLAVGAAVSVTISSLDILSYGATVALRGTSSLSAVVRLVWPLVVVNTTLFTPVVATLALAYRVSPWTFPALAVPAVVLHYLYSLYEERIALLRRDQDSLKRAAFSFAGGVVAAIDATDQYTAGHSTAVATYARDIAAELGLADEEQEAAYLTGLVHDVGKLGLPMGLLTKPGPLTAAEREAMQRHVELGESILVPNYGEIAPIVRHHHERVDGQGYPDRLAGEAIPLLARIIAVADTYHAMTSDRPYRRAYPTYQARIRMLDAAGSQLDPNVVSAFEAILARSSDSYRRGHFDEQRDLDPIALCPANAG